jgi:hypothetical protein
MLMITVESEGEIVTLRLDGPLAGPEAIELAKHWREAAFKQPHQRLQFDLTGVSYVDVMGKEFLSRAHRNGYRLMAGVTTQAMVDEIVARSGIDHEIEGESGAIRDGPSGRVHAVLSS